RLEHGRRRARGRDRRRVSRGERSEPEPAVLLVRRGDDAERLAARPVAEPCARGIGERRREEPLDPREAVRRERERATRMRPADCAAGARREADELADGAALDARRHVRKVAREPGELELERERERVERGPAAGRLDLVEEVEEARERRERPLVPLGLAEEPQHRLRPDQPDAEPVRLLPYSP